jgi:hypothetical protein
MPSWFNKTDIPLFVSHRRLKGYKTLPKAKGIWALDSGGFTELSMHGKWETTSKQYIEAIQRYKDIGGLQWVAPQDWMCEPWIIAKTGHTIREHQKRTVENYAELQNALGDLVIPVIQGWTIHDYHQCIQIYADNGINLAQHHTVGLGSVCRRQGTQQIGDIITDLTNNYQLKLHGFGVKTQGIRQYGHLLASADSMAWSRAGRYIRPCPQNNIKNCGNCLHYALEWRQQITEPARISAKEPQ